MKLKDIATELGVSDTQIRKWKNQDNWDDEVNSNVTNQKPRSKGNVTKRIGAPKGNMNAVGNKGGAPPGNKNAVGNSGGVGGPEGNDKAVTHGLFRRFLPDNVEYREIFDAAADMNPLDMLWTQIQIKFANIIHAQKVMFVQDQDHIVKHLKKKKDGDAFTEREWEFQYPWDRQAAALNSQARAMGQLTSMIRQYEEMLPDGRGDEERKLKLDKLKAEVDKAQQEAKLLSKDTGKEPLKIEIDYGDDDDDSDSG